MSFKHLKLGMCNLTGSPIKTGVNPNCAETINICNQLNELAFCEIINTFNGDTDFNSIYVEDADPLKYNAILIMNSNANFFGGAKNEGILQIYQFLAKVRCPIFYLFNDTNLMFSQLWGQIKNRDWNTLTEADVKITAPFYIISQFRNLENLLRKKISPQIDIAEVREIDFGTWILKDYKNKFVKNIGEYDFIYGGAFRGGKREAKFKDFFFNRSVKTAVYGSMKAKQFKTLQSTDKEPIWLGRVNCTDVIDTNAKGFSTVIVGEKYYNNNIDTLRLYETALAGCIIFVDNDFDNQHIIFDTDFNYVSSGAEIDEKIKQLKNDSALYNSIMAAQLRFLERKAKIDYVNEILSFINEKI